MAVRFGRVGNNNPTDGVVDHYDLLHKGVYTHAELDLIADEVSAARGSYPSLDARLESFVEGEGGGTTASYLFEAVIIDIPETTEVFISEFYTVGVKELDVFVGGVRQRTGIDYEETSSNSVTFTYGLMPGDVVAFRVRDRKGILKPINKTSEYVITEEGVTTYDIGASFKRYGVSLEVYLNGALQSIDVDYETPFDYSVTLLEEPPIGSVLHFIVVDKLRDDSPRTLEEVFSFAGDSLFTLTSFTYEVGKDQIEVYVNGLLQQVGVDYIETSPSSFQFLDVLSSGSEIRACKENGPVIPSSGGGGGGDVEFVLPEHLFNGMDVDLVMPAGFSSDTVTVPVYPTGRHYFIAFLNGQAVKVTELTNTSIQFAATLIEGDVVRLWSPPQIRTELDRLVKSKRNGISVVGETTSIIEIAIESSAVDIRYLRAVSALGMDAKFSILESPSDPDSIITIDVVSEEIAAYTGNMPFVDDDTDGKLYLQVENRSSSTLVFDFTVKYMIHAS